MRLVLDASLAIAWILGDEDVSPLPIQNGDEWIVPSVFRFEIVHSVRKALNRQRISSQDAVEGLQNLMLFPIVTVSPSESLISLWDDVQRFELNSYDSAYLRLALDYGYPIATLDSAMIRNADRLGVVRLPISGQH